MIIWNGIDAYPKDAGPAVATLGNYDGVHLGHAAILKGVVHEAARRRARALVVTFDPHPMSVVAPSRRPKLLLTRRQKLETLEELGLDGVLVLAFDASVAALSPEAFVDLLVARVPLASVHVGRGFRFGHGRAGDLDALRAAGSKHGFEVHGVEPVAVDGETVSSSAIRGALDDGDPERAGRLLGRPFAVTGIVVPGERRGRSLDFPTANLRVENEIVPRRGVYVTETSALVSRYPSVTNVGVRPTFDGTALTVETHIMDFDDDLYGERIEVRFLARIRDEVRFGSSAELADQIARDRAAATAWFQRVALPS